MAWPANPVATGCQGNPCSTGIRWGVSPAAQMGCLRNRSGSPSGGRPAVSGKRTYGGRPGQRVEEQGTWASQKHSEAGDGRPVDRGVWTANTVKRPRQQPAHPQYANYWAPLTRKRHIPPHPTQPRHTNHGAPRTRKRHQQEHRPQRPTERSDPRQHAKGRTGDRPGPRKGTATRRNVTQGGGGSVATGGGPSVLPPAAPWAAAAPALPALTTGLRRERGPRGERCALAFCPRAVSSCAGVPPPHFTPGGEGPARDGAGLT